MPGTEQVTGPAPPQASPVLPCASPTNASGEPDIPDVSVPFAFPSPYAVQARVMSAIFRALERGEVALIESPTGTGKSLSILCSTLYWIFHRYPAQREAALAASRRAALVSSEEETASDAVPDWLFDSVEDQRASSVALRRHMIVLTRRSLASLGENLKRQLYSARNILSDAGVGAGTGTSGGYAALGEDLAADGIAGGWHQRRRRGRDHSDDDEDEGDEEEIRSLDRKLLLPSSALTDSSSAGFPADSSGSVDEHEAAAARLSAALGLVSAAPSAAPGAALVSAAAATRAGLDLALLRAVTGTSNVDAGLSILATVSKGVRAAAEADAETWRASRGEGASGGFDGSEQSAGELSATILSQYPTHGTMLAPVLTALGVLSGHSSSKGADQRGDDADDMYVRQPKLIYCSRTHSQLGQVVGEVRRVLGGVYPPGESLEKQSLYEGLSVVAVGSRGLLCSHPAVRSLGGERVNERCRELREATSAKKGKGGIVKPHVTLVSGTDGAAVEEEAPEGGCPYLRPQRQFAFSQLLLSTLLDVEEAATRAHDAGACGYYAARAAVAGADVVLAPYASIFHEPTREALGLPLEGAVVVVDEAHNLVETVQSLLSVTAGLGQLRVATGQLKRYRDRYSKRLAPGNLDRLNEMIAVVDAIATVLATPVKNSEAGRTSLGGFPAAAAASDDVTASSEDDSITDTLLRPNELLLAGNIDNINLFALCAWAERADLSRKLIGFVEHIDPSRAHSHVQEKQKKGPEDWFTGAIAIDASDSLVSHARAKGRRKGVLPDDDPHTAAAAAAERAVRRAVDAQARAKLGSDGLAAAGLGASAPVGGPGAGGRGLFLTASAPPVETEEQDKDDLLRWLPPEVSSSPAAAHAWQVSAARAALALVGALRSSDGDARVLLRRPPPDTPGQQGQSEGTAWEVRCLVLSPSAAFAHVASKARAVILMGGTMRPFDLLEQQLKPPPPQEVKSPHGATEAGGTPGAPVKPFFSLAVGHVISPSRVFAASISLGPLYAHTHTPFRFTRARRAAAPLLRRELASLLAAAARVVPAGVAVFFTSYAVENEFADYLQTHAAADGARLGKGREEGSLWAAIDAKKQIFREPRVSNDAGAVFERYSRAARGLPPLELDGDSFSSGGRTGAMLFCVMGGKMSEGLNFSDDVARCVIVVGMPYPPRGDPELREKMRRLDATAPAAGSPTGASAGERYYSSLCMRSVNQSIGRALRHANDYAAVLLVDERYATPQVAGMLPEWLSKGMMRGVRGTISKMESRVSAAEERIRVFCSHASLPAPAPAQFDKAHCRRGAALVRSNSSAEVGSFSGSMPHGEGEVSPFINHLPTCSLSDAASLPAAASFFSSFFASPRFAHAPPRPYTPADAARLSSPLAAVALPRGAATAPLLWELLERASSGVASEQETVGVTMGIASAEHATVLAPHLSTLYISHSLSPPNGSAQTSSTAAVASMVDAVLRAQDSRARALRDTALDNPDQAVRGNLYPPIIAEAGPSCAASACAWACGASSWAGAGTPAASAVVEGIRALVEAGAAGVVIGDTVAEAARAGPAPTIMAHTLSTAPAPESAVVPSVMVGGYFGRVLVPASELRGRLSLARLACDVIRSPTVLLARSDAAHSCLITSPLDPADAPYIIGATNARSPPLAEVIAALGATGAAPQRLVRAALAWDRAAGLCTFPMAVEAVLAREGVGAQRTSKRGSEQDRGGAAVWAERARHWASRAPELSLAAMRDLARGLGIDVVWCCEKARTPDGLYRSLPCQEHAAARLAYFPHRAAAVASSSEAGGRVSGPVRGCGWDVACCVMRSPSVPEATAFARALGRATGAGAGAGTEAGAGAGAEDPPSASTNRGHSAKLGVLIEPLSTDEWTGTGLHSPGASSPTGDADLRCFLSDLRPFGYLWASITTGGLAATLPAAAAAGKAVGQHGLLGWKVMAQQQAQRLAHAEGPTTSGGAKAEGLAVQAARAAAGISLGGAGTSSSASTDAARTQAGAGAGVEGGKGGTKKLRRPSDEELAEVFV